MVFGCSYYRDSVQFVSKSCLCFSVEYSSYNRTKQDFAFERQICKINSEINNIKYFLIFNSMPTHTFSTVAFKLFSFVNGKNHVFRSYSSQVLYGALLNMTLKPPICTERPRSIDFTLKRNYTSYHEKAIYSLQIFKFYFRD